MSEKKRPEWMSSISGIVDPEEYLLGRKIDKTFELSQQEKAERARKARADRIASGNLKLAGDPILELERRRQELKFELLSNPIKLKQFRERLLREEREEAEKNRELVAEKPSEPSASKEVASSSSQKHSRHRSPSPSSSSSPVHESHSRRKHQHIKSSSEISERSPHRSRSRSYRDHRHRRHGHRHNHSDRSIRSSDDYWRKDSSSRRSKSRHYDERR